MTGLKFRKTGLMLGMTGLKFRMTGLTFRTKPFDVILNEVKDLQKNIL